MAAKRWIPKSAVLLLCIGALLDLSLPLEGESVRRIYVLDLSESFERNEPRAREAIEEGLADLGPRDRVGLVAFAGAATVAVPPSPPDAFLPLPALLPPGSPGVTNLEAGLRRALRPGPDGPPSQVVLLTDGRETDGDALAAAAEARAAGVPIHPIRLGMPDLPDLRLDALRCPSQVRKGEAFLVEAIVSSARGGEVTLRLRRPGGEPRERSVFLEPGIPGSIEFMDQIDEAGFFRYEAALVGLPAETNRANNRAGATVRVGGRLEIVALSRTPARVSPLGRLPGVHLDAGTPDTAGPLDRADLILLDDLSRDDLGEARIDEIRRAVRDAGAGLLVLGGRRSFGPGGYAGSGLDSILPVASDPEERRTSGISLVVVLDASGSMAEATEGETKFRRAVKAILPFPSLGPADRLEVITFREEPRRAIPLEEVESQGAIREQLLQEAPGGGTRLLPALTLAVDDLAREGDRVRHVVVLSDGRTEEGDDLWTQWEEICRTHGEVTTSVIAVGRDVDEGRLREIARVGEGRFHRLPGITEALSDLFRQEVRIARGSLIREGETEVEVLEPRGPLAGLGAPPPLFGFVATAPREEATLFLRSGGYPILAGWRTGVGRVLAFPSALDSDWGGAWRTWEGLPGFLSQAVRWASRPVSLDRFRLRALPEGDGVSLEVEARDAGDPLRLLASLGEGDPRSLRQVGPGRYRVRLPLARDDTSTVLIFEETEAGRLLRGAIPGAVARPREMLDITTNRTLLERIAGMSGGRFGPAPSPATGGAETREYPLGGIFLWMALAIFILDLAISGLPLTRSPKRPIVDAAATRPAREGR